MSEYRVDDLAREADTTVGNVRVYQDRGLLPPPMRRGRVAVYTEAHLGRLRLILNMLGRGYTFAQIHEMISAWQSGRDLEDVLGLEDILTRPWSDEVPETISVKQLATEFGKHLTPGLVKRALRLGLLRRRGTNIVVTRPRLLHAARELLAAGVPLSAVLDIAERVKWHTDELARLFISTVDRYVVPEGEDWAPNGQEVPEITERAKRLRPLAQSAVAAYLAQSMSEQLDEWLDDRFGPLFHGDFGPGEH